MAKGKILQAIQPRNSMGYQVCKEYPTPEMGGWESHAAPEVFLARATEWQRIETQSRPTQPGDAPPSSCEPKLWRRPQVTWKCMCINSFILIIVSYYVYTYKRFNFVAMVFERRGSSTGPIGPNLTFPLQKFVQLIQGSSKMFKHLCLSMDMFKCTLTGVVLTFVTPKSTVSW